LSAQFSAVTLIQRATDVWLAIGDLSAWCVCLLLLGQLRLGQHYLTFRSLSSLAAATVAEGPALRVVVAVQAATVRHGTAKHLVVVPPLNHQSKLLLASHTP
jgi:hypothetical protein